MIEQRRKLGRNGGGRSLAKIRTLVCGVRGRGFKSYRMRKTETTLYTSFLKDSRSVCRSC